MPKIIVNDTVIECKLILFDLDGTLVDKDYRNKALAKTRYAAIKNIAGEDAAGRWAEFSGVDPESYEVDDKGPLSKAPRKEDLTVATTAIWLDGLNWFQAKEMAAKAYAAADAKQSKSFKAKLIPGTEKALKEMHNAGLLLGMGIVTLVRLLIGLPAWSAEPAWVFGAFLGVIGFMIGVGATTDWFKWAKGESTSDHHDWPAGTPRWRRYFGFSLDHKVIGIQYFVTSVILLGAAGTFALTGPWMVPTTISAPR